MPYPTWTQIDKHIWQSEEGMRHHAGGKWYPDFYIEKVGPKDWAVKWRVSACWSHYESLAEAKESIKTSLEYSERLSRRPA